MVRSSRTASSGSGGNPSSDGAEHFRLTIALTPAASGTRLTLVPSGFEPNQRRTFGGARYGWNMTGGKLVDLLARM